MRASHLGEGDGWNDCAVFAESDTRNDSGCLRAQRVFFKQLNGLSYGYEIHSAYKPILPSC